MPRTGPRKIVFWAIIEKYKVSILYTAPTAIRAFIKWGDHHVDKHDLSSLRLLGSVCEGSIRKLGCGTTTRLAAGFVRSSTHGGRPRPVNHDVAAAGCYRDQARVVHQSRCPVCPPSGRSFVSRMSGQSRWDAVYRKTMARHVARLFGVTTTVIRAVLDGSPAYVHLTEITLVKMMMATTGSWAESMT